MYGHTLGAAVALGYVSGPGGCGEQYFTAGHYEIGLPQGKLRARASLAPMYDPKNLRIRA
jgi:4-methylaminobutanoate oxidase (formaldehyde-forming)